MQGYYLQDICETVQLTLERQGEEGHRDRKEVSYIQRQHKP